MAMRRSIVQRTVPRTRSWTTVRRDAVPSRA